MNNENDTREHKFQEILTWLSDTAHEPIVVKWWTDFLATKQVDSSFASLANMISRLLYSNGLIIVDRQTGIFNSDRQYQIMEKVEQILNKNNVYLDQRIML